MITNETLRITSHSDSFAPFYLAPYTEAAIARHWPIYPQTLQHETLAIRRHYTEGPATVFLGDASLVSSTFWGVYPEEYSPDHFIGTVCLTDATVDAPPTGHKSSRPVQSLSATILSDEYQGKGLGTLSSLAMISHAMEHEGTVVIRAETSARNLAAQQCLSKIGLGKLGETERHLFPEGASTEEWLLVRPDIHDKWLSAGALTLDSLIALRRGWQTFRQKQADLQITSV